MNDWIVDQVGSMLIRLTPNVTTAYLNEFVFRFNRRFYPFNAFRSLLGLSVASESPTYAELYDGDWTHPGNDMRLIDLITEPLRDRIRKAATT